MTRKNRKKVQHEKAMLSKHKPQSHDTYLSCILTPHQKALLHFWQTQPELMADIESRGTIVLHHVDIMLKSQDPERYAEWRPEDLQPMEKRDHISMHNSHPHTKLHNRRISKGVKRAHEARQGCVIIAFDPLTDDTEIFPTAASAAASLGCTTQWAGQCLKNGWRCCGYKLMRFPGSQDDFTKAKEVCHA